MQFLFAGYTLDSDRRELCCGATTIDIEPQVFDLLHYLVRNRDRVVSKEDLVEAVWDGRPVSDSTIASRISAARKALGDDGRTQTLIRTVARKGVRFVGDVRTGSPRRESAPAAVPASSGAPDGPAAPSLPPPGRAAVAVLPFVNMSGEPEQEYFSDGISEDIITALSRLHSFLVIARNSSFSFKGKTVRLMQIAEELGVGYVVEGSVRKSGNRVRITAHLSDAATGRQIWGERWDRCLADVFAVQDEIADAIAAAIEPEVYAAERFRAARKPPESLDAWDLVMQALSHFWLVTRDDNMAAQTLLRKAVAISPDYAKAHAVLAVSHGFGMHMGWEDMATAVPAAACAAQAAIRAGDDDPWAHLATAVGVGYVGRIDDALAAHEQALRLNPNFSLALGYYGLTLASVGRWQEGAGAARRARRLSPRDPLSAIYDAVIGYAAFVGGDYDEAVQMARQAIRQRPDFAAACRILTASAALKGDLDAARAALRELRRAQPGLSLAWIARLSLYTREDVRQRYLEGFRRAGLE